MYRSTDTHDRPIAVTGTVLTPDAAWASARQRPIVSYDRNSRRRRRLPAIQGAGFGLRVRRPVHRHALARVRAVLDAIRAAQRLPEAHLPPAGPVAVAGYSQGGGASPAVAELQPSYAPELKLKGAYAGTVPADLAAVAHNLDGH
jgi:hypothetical protein